MVKLYDLTALCPESLDEGKNPFAVPVSMLLYRAVRNSKHYLTNEKPIYPDNIKMLLDICLKIVNGTKYSQVMNTL